MSDCFWLHHSNLHHHYFLLFFLLLPALPQYLFSTPQSLWFCWNLNLILLLLYSKHCNGFPTNFTKSKIQNLFYGLQGHPLPLKHHSLGHFSSFSLIQPHGLLAVLPTHQAHPCLGAFVWTTLLHGPHIDTCFIFLFKWHFPKDTSLNLLHKLAFPTSYHLYSLHPAPITTIRQVCYSLFIVWSLN